MTLELTIDQLKNGDDEFIRSDAAEKLSGFDGEEVILALIQAMGDNDQLVQGAAMESLKKCDSDPAPYLLDAIHDTRLLIRWGAVEMLEDYPSPETEETLRTALYDDSPHVRGAAARSLRNMKIAPETFKKLTELTDDSDSFPRYQALNTLTSIHQKSVDERLVIARDLGSGSVEDVVAAIHYIREHKKLEFLERVIQLQNDSEFRIQGAAEWAVERLSDEP